MKRIVSLILIAISLAALSGCAAVNDSSVLEGEIGTHSAAPLWVGKTFAYSWEEDSSPNLFLAWIDSGGVMDVNGMQNDKYSYNRPFLDWIREREDILLPVVKNDAYSFHGCAIVNDSNIYRTIFYDRKGVVLPHERAINFIFWPLSEADINQGVEVAFEKCKEEFKDYEIIRGAENSPWGEYLFEEDSLVACFLVSDFLVTVGIHSGGAVEEEKGSWSPELFGYFDFELVNFKKYKYTPPPPPVTPSYPSGSPENPYETSGPSGLPTAVPSGAPDAVPSAAPYAVSPAAPDAGLPEDIPSAVPSESPIQP